MPPSPHQAAARELPELAARLRRKSRKLTAPREAILRVLAAQKHPLSRQEIFDALPNRHCDLATVYRSLCLLEGMGMVKRYDFGDGASRFELLSEGDDGHHHHLVCTGCREVVEIPECRLEALDARLAARSGFQAVTHRLEFFGLCPACQGSKTRNRA